jgi:hypothetical protein
VKQEYMSSSRGKSSRRRFLKVAAIGAAVSVIGGDATEEKAVELQSNGTSRSDSSTQGSHDPSAIGLLHLVNPLQGTNELIANRVSLSFEMTDKH